MPTSCVQEGGEEDGGCQHEDTPKEEYDGGREGRLEYGQDHHAPQLVDKQGERMAKMMKRWINLHPTKKSYAIRMGKRSANKYTNLQEIGRLTATEGVWFLQKKRDMETKGERNLQDDEGDTDDTNKENQVMGWKGGRLTKMMKHRRNFHPTRKSYAIRTGKRSATKFTNVLKMGLLSGTEGMWFLQKKGDMETEGERNLQDEKDDTDDDKKENQVMGWKYGRLTKIMKRRRNLHATRKSYAFRTGKRSVEKFTDCLQIWLPRMSQGNEGNWFLQKDMEREKRVHGIFKIRKVALMTLREYNRLGDGYSRKTKSRKIMVNY